MVMVSRTDFVLFTPVPYVRWPVRGDPVRGPRQRRPGCLAVLRHHRALGLRAQEVTCHCREVVWLRPMQACISGLHNYLSSHFIHCRPLLHALFVTTVVFASMASTLVAQTSFLRLVSKSSFSAHRCRSSHSLNKTFPQLVSKLPGHLWLTDRLCRGHICVLRHGLPTRCAAIPLLSTSSVRRQQRQCVRQHCRGPGTGQTRQHEYLATAGCC